MADEHRSVNHLPVGSIDQWRLKGREVQNVLHSRAAKVIASGALTFISPALLAILARSPIALAGSALMLVGAVVCLVSPSGFSGFLLSMFLWAGALSLGATGMALSLTKARLSALEAHSSQRDEELIALRTKWERAALQALKREGEGRREVGEPTFGEPIEPSRERARA